jgi:hypothetical protein
LVNRRIIVSNNRRSQLAALEAAKIALADKSTTLVEEADKRGVSRGSATHAKMILEFGTEEEITQAKEGFIGLKHLRDDIMKRLPPEQIKEIRARNGAFSETARRSRHSGAELWARLSPMLKGVTLLPDPDDMVKIVKASHSREKSVNQYLNAASLWIKEFENAWRTYKNSKPNNHSSDAGDGNGDAGTQHSEPTT